MDMHDKHITNDAADVTTAAAQIDPDPAYVSDLNTGNYIGAPLTATAFEADVSTAPALTSLPDALSGEELETELKWIESYYEEWQPMADRSNAAAYEALGRIFEISAKVPVGSAAHDRLIDAVNEKLKAECAGSKYQAARASVDDLLLTLIFGTKERRPTKSQWKAALTSAARAEPAVPRTVAAFQGFMKTVGGIEGAAGLRKPKPKKTDEAEDAYEIVRGFIEDQGDIQAEAVQGGIPGVGSGCAGLSIVLVYRREIAVGEPDTVIFPLVTSDSEDVLATFVRLIEQDGKKEQYRFYKGYLAEKAKKCKKVNDILRNLHRREYLKEKKAGKTKMSNLQFARSVEGLDPYSLEVPDHVVSQYINADSRQSFLVQPIA
jgi:hypothetical protein